MRRRANCSRVDPEKTSGRPANGWKVGPFLASGQIARVMTGGRFESELALVKRIADELAQKQKERVSSAHLLAAIAARPSPASDLLRERKLGVEELLRAARGVEEELDEPLKACLQRAREIAGRMGDGDAAAVHLLVALVGEPRSSARRVLEGLNVDTSRRTGWPGLGWSASFVTRASARSSPAATAAGLEGRQSSVVSAAAQVGERRGFGSSTVACRNSGDARCGRDRARDGSTERCAEGTRGCDTLGATRAIAR
jgi:Clp amino terminal domain, pathogenicity island component